MILHVWKDAGMSQNWSIEFHEGLLWTWPFDKLFTGRRAAHTYLRLLDGDKNVVHEIHGVASMDINDKPEVFRPTLTNLFNLVSMPFCDNKHLRLRVVHSDGVFPMSLQRRIKTQLYEGEEGKMRLYWNAALQRANEINDMKLPYRPFGVFRGGGMNCNMVSRNLCTAMGVNVEELETQSYAPGFKNRLIDVFNSQNWSNLWEDIKREKQDVQERATQSIKEQTDRWNDQIKKLWGRWRP